MQEKGRLKVSSTLLRERRVFGRDLEITSAGFPGGSEVKASAPNAGDPGSVPGLGRFPGEGNDSSVLPWRIPWTEKPGRLQSMGSQRVRHD